MRFFVLKQKIGSLDETEFEKVEPVHLVEAPRCDQCGRFVGMMRWLPPYRALVRAHSEELGDLAFGVGASLLVSSAFRHAWESARLRGLARFDSLEALTIRPARFVRRASEYFHVEVNSIVASIDEARSIIDRTEPPNCNRCRSGGGIRSIRGFAIAQETWTGEDIFYPRGLPGIMVVTERVEQLAKDYSLKNVPLVPVSDFVQDPLNVYPGQPDRPIAN